MQFQSVDFCQKTCRILGANGLKFSLLPSGLGNNDGDSNFSKNYDVKLSRGKKTKQMDEIPGLWSRKVTHANEI